MCQRLNIFIKAFLPYNIRVIFKFAHFNVQAAIADVNEMLKIRVVSAFKMSHGGLISQILCDIQSHSAFQSSLNVRKYCRQFHYQIVIDQCFTKPLLYEVDYECLFKNFIPCIY